MATTSIPREESGVVEYAGMKCTLVKVPYRGQAITFAVDSRTVVVACVWPASGPSLTLGTSVTSNTLEVTAAAGGAHAGGNIVVACSKI